MKNNKNPCEADLFVQTFTGAKTRVKRSRSRLLVSASGKTILRDRAHQRNLFTYLFTR